MKLCVFHTGTMRASWSVQVFAEKLRGLGHEVIDAVIPTNEHGQVLHGQSGYNLRRFQQKLPTIQQLRDCDFVLCITVEYYLLWLKYLYADAWFDLRNRVAFYGESSDRLDYEPYKRFSDIQFYPDAEDAKKYGGKVAIPFADTSTFHPMQEGKIYDVGFLGTLYPSRMQFINAISPYLDGLNVSFGEVRVFDLGGENQRVWADLNAKNINQMKIHLALPGNNTRMASARHFETLACGTFLLTPKVDLLEDKVHCRFYDPHNVKQCSELIRYYIEHDTERNHIATRGWAHVCLNYSAEKVLCDLMTTLRKSSILTTHSI